MRRTSLLTPILLLHLTLLALAAASVNESVNESAVPEGGQELADAGDSQGERAPHSPILRSQTPRKVCAS